MWEAGRAPGNAVTFISLRMHDESLSVSTALYNCSWSRTTVRCFTDTTLSAIAMPCNRDVSTPHHSPGRAKQGFREGEARNGSWRTELLCKKSFKMQIIPDLKKLDSQIYKILVLSNPTLHNRKYLHALGIQTRAVLRREQRERTNPRHLIDRTG